MTECEIACSNLQKSFFVDQAVAQEFCKLFYCKEQSTLDFLYASNYSPTDICQLTDIGVEYNQMLEEIGK